jgi:hypothetical protein
MLRLGGTVSVANVVLAIVKSDAPRFEQTAGEA